MATPPAASPSASAWRCSTSCWRRGCSAASIATRCAAACWRATAPRASADSGPASSSMSNLGLYSVAVLIWGSTWLVIKFQLGVVPPMVSVSWRFALAALMLLAYCAIRRRPLRFSMRDHLWMALQGILLFGVNYAGVYLAEQYLTSGLVAVVF